MKNLTLILIIAAVVAAGVFVFMKSSERVSKIKAENQMLKDQNQALQEKADKWQKIVILLTDSVKGDKTKLDSLEKIDLDSVYYDALRADSILSILYPREDRAEDGNDHSGSGKSNNQDGPGT